MVDGFNMFQIFNPSEKHLSINHPKYLKNLGNQ